LGVCFPFIPPLFPSLESPFFFSLTSSKPFSQEAGFFFSRSSADFLRPPFRDALRRTDRRLWAPALWKRGYGPRFAFLPPSPLSGTFLLPFYRGRLMVGIPGSALAIRSAFDSPSPAVAASYHFSTRLACQDGSLSIQDWRRFRVLSHF